MAIGNGYMNSKMNIDTSVRFAYGHGIIDQKVWNTLEMECCRGCIGKGKIFKIKIQKLFFRWL